MKGPAASFPYIPPTMRLLPLPHVPFPGSTYPISVASNPPLEPESKLCNPNDACSGALPTLEDVLDEVHASIQEMMKSLKRKRHSGSLEARGAMWLLERVNGVIHQAREKIKQVEQHDIMKKYFRQQFAEMEQKQKLLSQQLEIKLLSVSQQNEKLLSQLFSQQLPLKQPAWGQAWLDAGPEMPGQTRIRDARESGTHAHT